MDDLFLALALLSILGLIVGLIKPNLFKKIFKKRTNRKTVGLVFGSAIVLFFILFGVTSPNTAKTNNTPASTPVSTSTTTSTPTETPKVNNDWKAPVKAKFNDAMNQYKKVYSDMLSALPKTQPPKGDIYQRIQDVNIPGTVDYTWSQFRQKTDIPTIDYSIGRDLEDSIPQEKAKICSGVEEKMYDTAIALMDLEDVCTPWLIGNKTNQDKSNAQSKVDQAISNVEKGIADCLK